MYVSNNLGNFGGLGSVWGNTEDPVKEVTKKIEEKLPSTSADPVSKIEAEVKELEKELPKAAPRKPSLVNPEDYIPKPKEVMGANEAMHFLKRPQGARGGHSSQIKGQVYWTQNGPQFSQKEIRGGGTAEAVPPPTLKLRPNVSVVRDLPALKTLTPVETSAPTPTTPALQGFGEAKTINWVSVAVLGLLFFAIFGYNTP